MRKTLLFVAGLTITLPSLADTISAERPGFASGPVPLSQGTHQVELGYQAFDAGEVDVHTLPLLLYRYGMGDNLELQIGWAGYNEVGLPGSGSIDGFSDVSVGVKTQLNEGSEGPTAFGVFGGVSLPVGSSEFSSDSVDPTVGLFWTHQQDSQPGLFGTVLASSIDSDLAGGVSVGTGFSIDEKRSFYAEVFSLFAENSGPSHTINGGITYLANDDVQLDAHVGIGLNDRAGDFFIGLGLARRWP